MTMRYAVYSFRRPVPGQPGLLREWFKVAHRRTGKTVQTFPEHEERAAFELARTLNSGRRRVRRSS